MELELLMLAILADADATTPLIITILTLIGPGLILVLTQVAKMLYQRLDKSTEVVAQRMSLFADHEYKIKVRIINNTSKTSELRAFSLVEHQGSAYLPLSAISEMPIQTSHEANCIYGDEKVGFSVRIDPYEKRTIILTFKINESIKIDPEMEIHLSYVTKKGKRRAAEISLFTDKVQALHFKNIR